MLSNCGAEEDSWELLDFKEIKLVNPKRNQPRIFIRRTDAEAEAEAPILRPPNTKSWLIGQDPDAVKDWMQKEKRAAEDEMVGGHHWLSGMNLSKLQETVEDRGAWCATVHGVTELETT